MILSILISTIDLGIDRIASVLLEPRHDIQYIISHQYRNKKYLSIPKKLIRDDIIISQIPGQGLMKSRNNAIKFAMGDICVIADDDVRYSDEYLDTIIRIYSENEIDIACFKIRTNKGEQEYKNYPSKWTLLKDIKKYSPSSIEITFKRKMIIDNKISFDERFGLGSWINGGGERLFIFDAIKKGLKVYFFPEYIVRHPYNSTIRTLSKYNKKRNKVGGAFDARINGFISIPKVFLVTIRNLPDLIKHNKNPLIYLKERLFAAIYILRTNKK